MRVGGNSYNVDWGHLAVATAIAAACVIYLFDARATSLKIQNLLLLQPTVILVLLLYVLIVPQCVRRAEAAPANEEAGTARERRMELLQVGSLAAAFGLFVFSMDRLGFDVAAWLFTLVGLFICGERRPLVLLIYPLVFAAVLVFGYRQLIPYPFPALLF